ncbi:MAG: zinc-finger domain-containing protein [Kiloniellaceae bacterium]
MTNPPEPPETIEVETEIVDCDGGGGGRGPPRVWLNMTGRPAIDCPYCDRRFVLKKGAAPGGR